MKFMLNLIATYSVPTLLVLLSLLGTIAAFRNDRYDAAHSDEWRNRNSH